MSYWRVVVVVSTCVFTILEIEARHLSLYIFNHFPALDVSGHDKITALLLNICDCVLLIKDSSYINFFLYALICYNSTEKKTLCTHDAYTNLPIELQRKEKKGSKRKSIKSTIECSSLVLRGQDHSTNSQKRIFQLHN